MCANYRAPEHMKIYVVQGFAVRQVEAEIDGELARIALPWGACKVLKRPKWSATEAEAVAHVVSLRERRLRSLKRQIKQLTAGAKSG